MDCLDSVACLDLREQREVVGTLVYLAPREIPESKESEDSRALQDHLGLLVRLAALEIQDHLALSEKLEPLV